MGKSKCLAVRVARINLEVSGVYGGERSNLSLRSRPYGRQAFAVWAGKTAGMNERSLRERMNEAVFPAGEKHQG